MVCKRFQSWKNASGKLLLLLLLMPLPLLLPLLVCNNSCTASASQQSQFRNASEKVAHVCWCGSVRPTAVPSRNSRYLRPYMCFITCFGELCHPQRGGAYPPQTRDRCIKESRHLGHAWGHELAAVGEERNSRRGIGRYRQW